MLGFKTLTLTLTFFKKTKSVKDVRVCNVPSRTKMPLESLYKKPL